MQYPEEFIKPMREELTRLGVEECRMAVDVDRLLQQKNGTVLMIINSMCGCAAGRARPGVALALNHSVRPDRLATVFAGGDLEATARAREHIKDYPPSSPSMALFRDGELVFMLERYQIEGCEAEQIAQMLVQAFDEYCVKQPS